jgi:hypothetical protein
MATMMKSKTFHGSIKYFQGCLPFEIIFRAISIVKRMITSRSITDRTSWYWFAGPGYVSNPIMTADRRISEKMKLLKSLLLTIFLAISVNRFIIFVF